MSADYLQRLPLTKWLLEEYAANHSTRFPGGGKTHYDQVLIGTHQYLNEYVHPTIQDRLPLKEAGIYLTDHGPKHIELVLRRASTLVRTDRSARSEQTRSEFFQAGIEPYEALLLALAIHFHDVGNMYGRAGHEERIGDVMEKIGSLAPLAWHQKRMIAQIARCHGGTIEGDKDTIRTLPTELHDGDVRYRPQLIAAVLRLADELADEYSRADQFGLLAANELPETSLLFQKYAQALRVSINLVAGQVRLRFQLNAEDLRAPLKKRGADGTETNVYLLDEIYARTLKTYTEVVYCSKYMRALDTYISEVRVEIDIFQSLRHPEALETFSYTIGDLGYPTPPEAPQEALRRLARGFDALRDGATMAEFLNAKEAAVTA